MSRCAETVLVALVGLATLALHFVLFERYLPGPNGTIGHDYSYFFPQLLNGTYWYLNNGALEVPWFTPAFGAGMPYYPNPVNTYYSVPQLLAFFVDPLEASRATLVVFAAAGFGGTYLLLRRVFETSIAGALLGACAFAFNGFFSHRMLVGHIAFHSFMLIPLIAYWTLGRAREQEARSWRAVQDITLLALAYAYLFQSANVHGIPVVILAVMAFALMLSMSRGWSWVWIERTAIAGGLALALCAAKLSAVAAFMGSFPRTGYPLPGFDTPLSALRVAAESLFLAAPIERATESIVNSTWNLDRHEFEYGVTVVPLVLIAAGLIRGVIGLARSSSARDLARHRGWMGVLLLLLLAVPIALNTYGPTTPNLHGPGLDGSVWADFIKSIPLLGSSSSMIRFLSLYVPVTIVGAVLCLERLELPAGALRVTAAVAVLGMIDLHWNVERGYYEGQPYDPAPVVQAWQDVRDTGRVPAVERIVAPLDSEGRPALSIDRNDALIRGESQLVCYEPIFGYQQEWFPFGPARFMQPALEPLEGGFLNVKNPACFVFPEENDGEPGSHFRVDQREAAESFLAYRPFEFQQSRMQAIANGINVAALILVAVLLALCAFRAEHLKRRS